jgi:hypothetical protein
MYLIQISTLVIGPPTPSFVVVVEAVAFCATHPVLDGCVLLVAVLFPSAALAVMFGWKVISAGVTIGVAGGVTTFGALPIG